MFELPKYNKPNFEELDLLNAQDIKVEVCEKDGVVPDYFHSTSMFPEYFKIDGEWILAEESRMDSCVVVGEDKKLSVIEQRNVKKGDKVILGRSEDGHEGIYVHTNGFEDKDRNNEKFQFRTGRSRETSYAKDYDRLYELLEYEKENGKVVFVMGPACAFDHDARVAVQSLIDRGYIHGLLAGNALATHDLEAGVFETALGQHVYSQESVENGHYNHLDILNKVRRAGSIKAFIEEGNVKDGIMYGLIKNNVPFVLTSSIRDDGPLPEVIHSAYEGQKAMRNVIKDATTVICLATQLHTIATGNMTPSFRVVNGVVRPVYFYAVDISEFVTNKLLDRGSLSATTMTTNVQDFVYFLSKGVK